MEMTKRCNINNYRNIASFDQTDIFYYRLLPERPKAIVLISHGYGGHSGQYTHLADFLYRHGYGVYALDHRGHGRSPSPKGHIANYQHFIDDLNYLIKFIKKTHPETPLYTFGHSMGGFIAFSYALLHPNNLQGQIFSAPALGAPWGTHLLPSWFWQLSGSYLSELRIYHIIKRPSCRDPLFKQTRRQDPYVLKYATLGFFNEFVHRGIHWASSNSGNYELPCLILHGKQDKIIPYQSSVQIYSQIKAQDKQIRLYEKLNHELIQEPEKELVLQDILTWLNQRV